MNEQDLADSIDEMVSNAQGAAELMKSLSHEGRLLILCHLVGRERSVTELEELLDLRQAAVSQHLARLRADGLVEARRDGKTMYYSLADTRSTRILEVLHDIYCLTSDS